MILLACRVAHPSPDDHWPQKCGESEPDRLWCVRQHWGSMRDAIALSSLRSIHCDLCHVGSVAALAAHPSLTELALQRTRLDDPRSLGALVNLESLTLTDTGLRDLRALVPLTQLRALTIEDDKLADLAGLARFEDLEHLWIGSNAVRTVIDLTHHPHLTDLYLRLPFAPPPTGLASLTELREIMWIGRSIVDASALLELPALRRVGINHHCIPQARADELERALKARHVDVTIMNRSPDCPPPRTTR